MSGETSDREIGEQVRKAQTAFRTLSTKIFGNVGEAILKTALMIERDVKENFTPSPGSGTAHIPSRPGEAPAVDTGRLRASITHRTGGSREDPFAEVGTNVEYALALEFGTTKMEPRPFLEPALERNRATIREMIAEATRRAAEEASE